MMVNNNQDIINTIGKISATMPFAVSLQPLQTILRSFALNPVNSLSICAQQLEKILQLLYSQDFMNQHIIAEKKNFWKR